MRRLLIFTAALVLLAQAPPSQAETQTWFGFQVGISGGSAPPPPVVFRSEPHVIVVNDVYVVDDDRCDDDMFRAGNLWWRLRGGYWYRASTWRGPWVASHSSRSRAVCSTVSKLAVEPVTDWL